MMTKDNSKSLNLVAVCVLLLWLLLEANRVFLQAQALLFGGLVPLPSVSLKVLLVILLCVSVPLCKKVSLPIWYCKIWALIAFYLFFQFFYQQFAGGHSAFFLLFSFNANYSFFLLFPLFFVLNGTLSYEKMVPFLMATAVAFILLGGLQFLINDPVLSVSGQEILDKSVPFAGTLQVMSYDFYGNVRAFSLFDSGLRFGFYLVFILAVMFFYVSGSDGIRFWGKIFLITLIIVCIYMTLTRLVYLQAIAVLATCILFHLPERFRKQYLLRAPFFYGLVAFSLAFLLPALAKYLSADVPLFSSESMFMRVNQWHECVFLWFKDLPTFFFGTGLIENSRFPQTRSLIIDNSFIAYGVQGGVFGLLLYLVIMRKLWHFALKEALMNPSPISLGIACAMSAWPVVAMFGMTGSEYALLLLPLILGGVSADTPLAQGRQQFAKRCSLVLF